MPKELLKIETMFSKKVKRSIIAALNLDLIYYIYKVYFLSEMAGTQLKFFIAVVFVNGILLATIWNAIDNPEKEM
jgi:hypothetical protein